MIYFINPLCSGASAPSSSASADADADADAHPDSSSSDSDADSNSLSNDASTSSRRSSLNDSIHSIDLRGRRLSLESGAESYTATDDDQMPAPVTQHVLRKKHVKKAQVCAHCGQKVFGLAKQAIQCRRTSS